jgi:hypothetical protein
MSGDALLAIWNAAPIDWDFLEPFRLAIERKRRPSKHAIAIIDQALALCVIPSRGYADPTYEQILARCPSIKSTETVKYVLQVLTDSGRWVTVKGPCQGQQGMPGRAPQRVFFKHDPKNLLEKLDFSECGTDAISQNTEMGEINQEKVSARPIPNQQRIKELELKIADWGECAAKGPARVTSLAEKQIVALRNELEKELMNL